jgi:hypothetical protein
MSGLELDGYVIGSIGQNRCEREKLPPHMGADDGVTPVYLVREFFRSYN